MFILYFFVVSRNVECNWVDSRLGEIFIKVVFIEGFGNVIYYFWIVGIDGVNVR